LVLNLHGYALELGFLRPMFALWLGPALYAYFMCVQQAQTQFSFLQAWHFLFALALFTLLYCMPSLRDGLDSAILASYLIYSILIARKILQGKQVLAHLAEFASPAYRWLLSLLLMAVLNILLELAIMLEFRPGIPLSDMLSMRIAAFAFLLLNGLTMLAALSRSHLLEWMYQLELQLGSQFESKLDSKLESNSDASNADESTTTLASEMSLALFARWEALVQSEQLHKLEFGITLAQAARKLQVPARQLSNAINQIYGNSFSVYLNDLRIKEAQLLLKENPDMTIIEVMSEAGFSSKSHFNKEFQRVTGLSPSAYREQANGD